MWRYWGILLWLAVLGLPWIVLVRGELRKRGVRRRSLLFDQHWESSQNLVQQKKWADALTELDRALALVSDDPAAESCHLLGKGESLLRFQRGYVLEEMGRLDEAIEAYRECQTPGWMTGGGVLPSVGQGSLPYSASILPSVGQGWPRQSAALRQAVLLAQLQRWEEAEIHLSTVVNEARRVNEDALQSNALHILMGIHQVRRKPDKVLDVTRQLFRLACAQGDEAKQALLWDIEGDANVALGKLDEALDGYECSLDLLRRVGDRESARVVEQDIARLYQVSGDWEKAIRWLDILLHKEKLISSHGASARVAYDLACLYIHTGDLKRAAGYLQQSSGLFRQAEDSAGAGLVGRTLLGLGILMHREATARWLTFADLKRAKGSAKSGTGEGEI